MAIRMWRVVFLSLLVGCTVGEVPPEGPRAPGADTVPAEPGDPADPGAAGVPTDAAEAAAATLLAEARLAYEAAELSAALDAARRAVREYPETPSGAAAAWVAARAAFGLGRWAEAIEMAEAFARAEPGTAAAEEARALAELARDELAAPADAPVRLGVVLPRTGSRLMVRYGDLLLEGIQLAVREAEGRERRPIELVVADDAGGTRTRAAVAELESRGVIAIVGPLLPQQLAEAAAARTTATLVTVSPTIPEDPQRENLYTVNTDDARGAQALGRYAAEVGLRRAALLYPRTPEHERKASAFAVEFEAMGGEVRIAVPYDSGTTTFAPHMGRILDAMAPRPPLYGDSVGSALVAPAPADTSGRPFALFVAAPDRDVRQIAPQVAFYGLDSAGVQVFGDEAWAGAAVRRVVPPQDLEGVIATSHFPPDRADALADPDFVRRYEERYRRSLDNQLPGLGYDAANLVLQALPNRMVTPGALARRFSLLAGLRGATGTFSVRAERVVRTPYLVIIRGGALAPAPTPAEHRLPQGAPFGADATGPVRR